jgi:hypothetical protein
MLDEDLKALKDALRKECDAVMEREGQYIRSKLPSVRSSRNTPL